jgi:DNA-binding PucR family transcriptional regulator
MERAPNRKDRAELYERLLARRGEIEEAIATRVYAISDPAGAVDPEYGVSLRDALGAAVDYAIEVIERGEVRAPPIPTVLLAQARMAARNEIGLDAVLRRYFAGYNLFADLLASEVQDGMASTELRRLLRDLSAPFERLIAIVSEEHARESAVKLNSREERRAERVRRLLDGELLDTGDLAYDFDAHHLGAVAHGPGVEEALRELAGRTDLRLLTVRSGEDSLWAWFGARLPLCNKDLRRHFATCPARITLAMGEPASGLRGWRLTHRQARAAFQIARRTKVSPVRYADVALLASMLQDDLLSVSLRQLYLEPLAGERDGGEKLRETLRAYFAADRNVSSAAAMLGVNRNTVTNRLRAVEVRLGDSIDARAADLEAALWVEELGERRRTHSWARC